MNKKGSLVLRNVVIMLFIASSVVILASIFVSDMAQTYGNTEMEDEFVGSAFAKDLNDSFYTSEDQVNDMQQNTSSGLAALIDGTLTGAQKVLETVFLAPNTFGNMIKVTLAELGVPKPIDTIMGIFVKTLLYVIIIFVIISAFLQGGKM